MDLHGFLVPKDNVVDYKIKKEQDDIITVDPQSDPPLFEEYILPNNIKFEETSSEQDLLQKYYLQDDTSSEDRNEDFTIGNVSNGVNVINITDSSLTKTGNTRKRKKYFRTKSERITFLKNQQRNYHQLKPPCSSMCRKRCSFTITNLCRQKINDMFWSMTWCEQKNFIIKMTLRKSVARKTVMTSKRLYTFKFSFHDDHGQLQDVCQTFFLATLGYNKNNNSILKNLPVKKNIPTIEKRGKYLRKLANYEDIKTNIESFHPVMSHFHHEHEPNKKYLPSDVTMKIMYDLFHEKNPTIKCSYDTYRRLVKDLNVNFTNVGNEECKTCAIYKKYIKKHNNCDITCIICAKYKLHRSRAQKSDEAYEFCSTSSLNETEICVSIDLQNIIMLPRIELNNQILLINRITLFNAIFVPVGKLDNVRKPMAAMWHEAISGCNNEDIISAFYKFFLQYRDMTKFKLCLENSVTQNKNWTMFTFFATAVNSPTINAEEIELVYFEPGHTCTSANIFHHQVELNLKKQKNTYDFNDFRDAVENAHKSNVIVHAMTEKDFYFWNDNSAQIKIKKMRDLKDMVKIRFKRGNNNLFYSVDYDGDNFIELPFLKSSFVKNGLTIPNRKQNPTGISERDHKQILKDVLPLLPTNRHSFWENLSVNNHSTKNNS